MKSFFETFIITMAAAALLFACSNWRETTVRITEDELQEHIAKKFPIKKTHRILGSAIYENPRISLNQKDNRALFGIDISLSAFMINGNPLSARIEFLATVAYDAGERALFLKDPRVQQFILNGTPAQKAPIPGELLMPTLEKLLKRKAIYRFEDQDSITAIAGKLVKDVRVHNNCLEIVWGL